jgi:hypothetical protein
MGPSRFSPGRWLEQTLRDNDTRRWNLVHAKHLTHVSLASS